MVKMFSCFIYKIIRPVSLGNIFISVKVNQSLLLLYERESIRSGNKSDMINKMTIVILSQDSIREVRTITMYSQ